MTSFVVDSLEFVLLRVNNVSGLWVLEALLFLCFAVIRCYSSLKNRINKLIKGIKQEPLVVLPLLPETPIFFYDIEVNRPVIGLSENS